MESTIKASHETLRKIAFGDISDKFTPVGSKFSHYIRIVEIDNTTDSNIIISMNGISEDRIVMARSGKVLDYSSNKDGNGSFGLPSGEYIQVKYIDGAPTVGNIYIACIYGDK